MATEWQQKGSRKKKNQFSLKEKKGYGATHLEIKLYYFPLLLYDINLLITEK